MDARNAPQKYQGMILFEVLISLVIFALGVLGIAGLLLLSNKANNSSYTKQQAVQSVYDIFDRIRANSTAAINGNYTISNISSSGNPKLPAQPSPSCATSICTPAQLAAYDTWYWLTYDVTQLPRGSGSITTAPAGTVGNTLVTITVQWDDSAAQTNLGSANAASATNPNFVQLSIQSQL
ncbi:MAG: type IV pilus modification protein PilV [Legionella sp.]|jgi:type IV pilus assembly protein PilV